MRVAVPVWQGRVSPVFDVAERLRVVEYAPDGQSSLHEEFFGDVEPQRRPQRLAELGVHTLICGAISGPLEMLLAGQGIRVVARVCGDVDQVLAAFRSGRLEATEFAMPGCRRQRRRRSRCRRRGG